MKFTKRSDETVPAPDQGVVEKPKSRKKAQESVIIYIVILFTVVFLLILISYFNQQRRSNNEIDTLTAEHSEFKTQALRNIEDLQSKNIELTEALSKSEKEAEELQGKAKELQNELEAIENELEAAESNADLAQKKYLAMCRYADLQAALAAENYESAAQANLWLLPMKEYLDGAYAEGYEAYLEGLNSAQNEEEND